MAALGSNNTAHMIYIRNMVCQRCIAAVQTVFRDLNIPYAYMGLGEVQLNHDLSPMQHEQLDSQLKALGFELIDDKKARIIEKIKTAVIELVHHSSEALKTNLSHYLTEKIPHEYNYLSSLFSEIEGTTIEKYYIAQKIERAKEFLVYDELTLSQIADELGYSSVAHLSNQFKKVTGLTPSHFKNIGTEKRKPLDKV